MKEELDLTQVSELQLDTHLPIQDQKIPEFNPFNRFIRNETPGTGKIVMPEFKLDYQEKPSDSVHPLTISTKAAQPYISKGFKLADMDIHNGLEMELSSTQSGWERKANNIKNAGANLVSMAVLTGFSNPLDMGFTTDLGDNTLGKKLFDWSAEKQKENYNYQTKNDIEAEGVWDNLTNWIDPTKDSTKGVGKLLESVAFGVGAGLGIMAQEAVVSYATGGSGTFPLLAAKIQQVVNSAKYLDKALDISRIAEKGALNLERVLSVGDITNSTAKGLRKIYKSQLGSHSEALFEGLEGKESLKNDLIREYEEIHGYKPLDVELAKIEKVATEAGQARYGINKALLSVTNFSQFNSLFKAYSPEKEIADGFLEKFGKAIGIDPITKKAVLNSTGYKITSPWFEKGIRAKLKPAIEGAIDVGQKEIVGNGLMEGVEEGLQFFTDKALNNYYSWKYHGDNKSANDAIYEGTKAMFSKEGIESIFTGIVSGAGQSAITKYFASLSPKFKAQKKLFETHQGELLDTYLKIDEKFQALPLEFKKKLVNVMNKSSVGGTVADKAQLLSATSGTSDILNQPEDEEQFNQALTHQFYTLALPYAKHGNIDILKAQFEEYKNLDDQAFMQTFGLSDIKNKNTTIDLYLKEFDAIQEAYRKSNNAFSKSPATPELQNEYNYLKTELAFSLYNSDKLIKDAKSLKGAIGDDYVQLLSNKGMSQSTIEANNNEIEELQKEIETPENNRLIAGLKKYNSYIERVLSGKVELKKGEYIDILKQLIVDPSVNKKYGKQNSLANYDNLDDKLNKIYQLSKIQDRVRYTQQKLDRILNSENPLDYLQQQENAFENEAFTYSRTVNPNPIVENKNIVEVITDEEYTKFQAGDVSKELLTSIAVKLKDKKSLSVRENEINNKFKDAINSILAAIKADEDKLVEILNPGEQQLPDPEIARKKKIEEDNRILNQQIERNKKLLEDEKIRLKKEKEKIILFNGETVIYNNETGVLSVSALGLIEIETEDRVYELGNIADYVYLSDLKIKLVQEIEQLNKYTTQSVNDDFIVINNVEYKIITNSIGNIVGLETKEGNILRNEALLIHAEIERNRSEYVQLEEIEELYVAAKTEFDEIRILENIYNLNITEGINDSIDKIYNQEKLDENEKLALKLWVNDVIDRINNLLKSYPTNENFLLSFKNLNLLKGLLNKDKSIKKLKNEKPRSNKKVVTPVSNTSPKTAITEVIIKEDLPIDLESSIITDLTAITSLNDLLEYYNNLIPEFQEKYKTLFTIAKEDLQLKNKILQNLNAPVEILPVIPIETEENDLTAKIAEINSRRQEEYKGNVIESFKTYSIDIEGKTYEIGEEIHIGSNNIFTYVKNKDGLFGSSVDTRNLLAKKQSNKKFLKDETEDFIDDEVKKEIDDKYDKEIEELINGKQEETEEELPIIDTDENDNIESKQYEALFLVDEKGEILYEARDQKAFNDRSAELINLQANGNIDAFTDAMNYDVIEEIKNAKSEPTKFSMEESLYKLDPKSGIRMSIKGVNMGFISTSDDLYVDLKIIEETINNKKIFDTKDRTSVIKDDTKRIFILYTDFLKELEGNVALFNTIKKTKVSTTNSAGDKVESTLLFRDVKEDIGMLNDKQTEYLKSKQILLQYLKADPTQKQLKDLIKKHNIIDYQAFIHYNKEVKDQLYKLEDTLLYNKSADNATGLLHGHVVTITWNQNPNERHNISIDQTLYSEEERMSGSKKNEEADAIIEYLNTLHTSFGKKKLVVVPQRNVDGSTSFRVLDTFNKAVDNSNLEETIDDRGELAEYLQQLDLQTNTIDGVKYTDDTKIRFSLQAHTILDNEDNLDLKVILTLPDQSELVENVIFKKKTSKGELLDIIKKQLDSGVVGKKSLQLNVSLYTVEQNKLLTGKSISNFNIKSYFGKNPKQIYSTLYLKVKPFQGVNIPKVDTAVVNTPPVPVDSNFEEPFFYEDQQQDFGDDMQSFDEGINLEDEAKNAELEKMLQDLEAQNNEPIIDVVNTSNNSLTQEEVDWLYDNLTLITKTYNTSTLFNSIDTNLKKELQFKDNTIVTAILPDAGGTPMFWFKRNSGNWLITITQKNDKIDLNLAKQNKNGSYYNQIISQEKITELLKKSGLLELTNDLYKDANVKQPATRLEQFELQNKIQQKYNLKRSYKDIVNQLKPLQNYSALNSNIPITPVNANLSFLQQILKRYDFATEQDKENIESLSEEEFEQIIKEDYPELDLSLPESVTSTGMFIEKEIQVNKSQSPIAATRIEEPTVNKEELKELIKRCV